ncbi:hypothetical protein [Arthrobacter sp. CG_A4]|uniref:hypothetical protein n=1 Tax=Arthrobacter sp. CG_A4 TaxID=3071706 RepID=UPI002E020F34|nr:hypothetical protein [Arthrobacter sp. CG_A4]
MYAWLFRQLPGPLWLRAAVSLVLLAAVVVALVEFVFPWVAHVTQLNGNTVG